MTNEVVVWERGMDRRTIPLAEAKARLSELTDRAESGEEIVITKRGRPVAMLSQVRAPRRVPDASSAAS